MQAKSGLHRYTCKGSLQGFSNLMGRTRVSPYKQHTKLFAQEASAQVHSAEQLQLSHRHNRCYAGSSCSIEGSCTCPGELA